jgi:trimeric autotransporter adhesin
MAPSSKVSLAVAVAAVLVVSVVGCTSSSDNMGLFTDRVSWGCVEPFNCFVEYCSCLNGTLSATCTPFNANVTAAQVEMCAARRVTCTLNAALNARNIYNSSCQGWGDQLAAQYALSYGNSSNTNLTDACKADMCGVVTAGNSSLADAVNYTYICSLVGFNYPAPVAKGDVAGCASVSRTYFGDSIPIKQCTGAASCMNTYCTCVGGTWNSTAIDCAWPAAQPATATVQTCLSAATGCLTKAALDIYVAGASPFSTDACLAWSVPIAQDYAAYYAATDKTTTELYKTCNRTACTNIYRYDHNASISSVCTFAAVAGIVPTFKAYDPCPYSCPDTTCAANLAGCACTANAVVSGVDASLSRDVTTDVDMTKPLTGTAYASYGIASGNCSSFTFGLSLKFLWTLSKADGTVVLTSNSSALNVVASTMVANTTYVLNLTATGLLASQRSTKTWTFKAVAPAPTVSITENGATVRMSNTQTITINAKVIDVVTGASNWSCTVISGTACPSLTNSTSSALIIPSGSPVGTFTITYTYRTSYTSSLNLTVVAGEIPYVRIITPSGALASNPMLVYLRKQNVLLTSVVQFTGNVTFSWTVNSNTTSASTTSSLALPASSLLTTLLANVNAANNDNVNTIRVKATSTADSSVYGEATISVIVVEDITVSLTVTSGAATSAAALASTLTFVPTTTPSLTAANAPLGATLQYYIVFYDTVASRDTAIGLTTTPSGSSFTATAPLFSNSAVSWQTTTFSVLVTLNGIIACTGNATFNITKPDIAAAATSELAKVSSITDSTQAVSAAGTLRALMQQSTNVAQVQAMASAALNMLSSTVANASTLSSTQQAAVFGTITTALGSQNATSKKALSEQIQSVITSALKSDNFDSSNAVLVLDAISSMDSQTGGQTSVSLAQALSNDQNQPIGEAKTVSVSGIIVTAVRQTGASLAGLAVQSSSGASLTLPASFSFAGLSQDAVYGVASTVLTTNPYGTTTPSGSVVTYDITSNGNSLTVSGLSDPIVIKVPGGVGVCAFYNEQTVAWSTTGLTTVVSASGFACKTTHLTAFATFTVSSAATVAVSAFVVLAAAFAQLLLA